MIFALFAIGSALAWARPRWGLYLAVAIVAAFPQYLLDPNAIAGLTFSRGDVPVNYLVFGLYTGLFVKHGWQMGQDLLPFMLPVYLLLGLFLGTGLLVGHQFKYIVMRFAPLLGYVTVVSIMITLSTEAELRRFMRFLLVVLALGCIGAIIEYSVGAGISHRGYVQGRSAKGMFDGFIGLSFCAFALVSPHVRRVLKISFLHVLVLMVIFMSSAVLDINRMTFICYALLLATLLLQVFRQGRLNVGALVVGMLVVAVVVYAGGQLDIHPYLRGDFSSLKFEADVHRQYEYVLVKNAFSGPPAILFLGEGAGVHWNRIWHNEWDFGCHNFYLELLWEKGIIGVILFTFAAIGYVVAAFRRHKLLQNAGYLELVHWIYVVLALILFMGITQNRFGSPKHTAIIGVLLGLPYAISRIARSVEIKGDGTSEERS